MVTNLKLPLGQDEIKKYLPHREPFLFVNRVTELGDNNITIESDIRPDAPHFQGHFPDMKILPGVLIVETTAQTGALLVALKGGVETGKFMAFSGIDSAKFKKPVYPNETIVVDVEIVKIRGPFYKFAGKAFVNDRTVALVDFSAAKMDFDQG